MPKHKYRVSFKTITSASRLVAVLLVAAVLSGVAAIAHADQYDDKINSLENQNSQTQSLVNDLTSQATSYKDAISKLAGQVAALQSAIAANQHKQAQLEQQIAKDQREITQKKAQLSATIKAMYIDGQTSTIEELASSKDLSDYVDKEEYRETVQNDLGAAIKEIAALQAKLQHQKHQLGIVLKSQQQQQGQLAAAQAKQQHLLNLNENQQAAYNHQINANESEIASLRAQQAAANRQLDGSGQVITHGSCGGTYPARASGDYGPWGCNYAHTSDFVPGCSYLDSWGMCNRECVSYTAWMVYKEYGISTVGFGNANQWPGSARSEGFSTGSTPRVGSVAIYMGGAFGHAMWVVGISGNQIHVHSYNDGYDGQYYDHWVSASGLTYIYFGS
ncbi:MAG TPA: CHAP domain-containing protein [Candidatus Saccharimonadales bacterium]|nr:CHAP domain-containing protein [Candidatus Saccharimonadales bacterium]